MEHMNECMCVCVCEEGGVEVMDVCDVGRYGYLLLTAVI